MARMTQIGKAIEDSVDGLTSTDTAIPTSKTLVNVLNFPFEVVIYQDATTTYARTHSGTLISSSPIASFADDVPIQAAIDYLVSTGGNILVKKALYQLAAGLTITANGISLFGESSCNYSFGENTGVVIAATTAAFVLLTIGSSGTHVSSPQLKHLNFQGATSNAHGLVVYSDMGLFEDIVILSCAVGMALHGASANVVKDCTFRNCTGAGLLTTCNDPRITNLWSFLNGTGLALQSSGAQVDNFHIWSCTAVGMKIEGSYNTISNGSIETQVSGCDAGLQFDSTTAALEANIVSDINFYGANVDYYLHFNAAANHDILNTRVTNCYFAVTCPNVGATRSASEQITGGMSNCTFLNGDATNILPTSFCTNTPLVNPNLAINGNFDIAQIATSTTAVTSPVYDLMDRWVRYVSADSGTLPTLTQSQATITPGTVLDSQYAYRIATNGAGTSLGANSYHYISQRIHKGTRFYCGLNKKITVSFVASTTISGTKRIGVSLTQIYGTGGSPTGAEAINGANFVVTSTPTRFTHTFTTNTLASKTFGTNNNDYLAVNIYAMWGDSQKAYVGAAAAETYVNSGNIDIMQVKVEVGNVATTFIANTVEDERNRCFAYYYKMPNQGVYTAFSTAYVNATTSGVVFFPIPTAFVSSPVIVTTGNFILQCAAGNLNATSFAVFSYNSGLLMMTVVLSGATAGQAGWLLANGDTSSYIAFNAQN